MKLSVSSSAVSADMPTCKQYGKCEGNIDTAQVTITVTVRMGLYMIITSAYQRESY
jgi:hypothetical protein